MSNKGHTIRFSTENYSPGEEKLYYVVKIYLAGYDLSDFDWIKLSLNLLMG